MTRFRSFDPVAPIAEATIAEFEGRVPAEVAALWRADGAGFVGDGFFRFVDPARAAALLGGVLALPEGSTVLFTTGLGDVVAHVNGIFLVVKSRFGAIDIVEGASFDELVALIEDPAQREVAWEWQPYPAARDRDGVPGFEECFGAVPPLTGDDSPTSEQLRLVGLAEHLALIVQEAGQPKVRRHLETATSAAGTSDAGAAVDTARLVAIGRGLFAKLTSAPELNIIELPDGLGVCLVHAVRGGGKIYVAPDETALFVGSAVDFEAGLGAFRDGVRTPPEKFELDRGGAGA